MLFDIIGLFPQKAAEDNNSIIDLAELRGELPPNRQPGLEASRAGTEAAVFQDEGVLSLERTPYVTAG